MAVKIARSIAVALTRIKRQVLAPRRRIVPAVAHLAHEPDHIRDLA